MLVKRLGDQPREERVEGSRFMLKVFARMTYAFAKACVLAAMTAACGCATILSRSRYNVPVQSNASATVEVRNRGELVMEARTPTMLTLPAKAGFFVPAKYTFTFKKPGCPDIVKSRSAYLDFMYVGNVVFGGLIGILIVDPATGAMWRMSEEPVSATYGQAIVEADAALAGSASPGGRQALHDRDVRSRSRRLALVQVRAESERRCCGRSFRLAPHTG